MIDDVLFDLLHNEIVEMFTSTETGSSKDIDVSKLELIGFNTGFRFVERITKDFPKFKEELDIMKYICKEFWSSIFKKQVDNLRTNRQGVYVLLDSKFRFLTQVSSSKQYLEVMPKYLAFTCGLIRGALSNLGVHAIVTGEITAPPSCRFQVQIRR